MNIIWLYLACNSFQVYILVISSLSIQIDIFWCQQEYNKQKQCSLGLDECEYKIILKNMNKQQILCFQIPIKSPKQISQLKKREQSQIVGAPKIVLGKLLNDVQQIWTEGYKCHKVSSLRDLYSNDTAFQIALLIINATRQLSKVYGNFILNENMVFMTKSKKTFIWINSDIFANASKIYLPQTKQGEVSMIKALINYFKLWLQTQYSTLSEIQTLEQISLKLLQLKRQRPPVLSKDASLAVLSMGSSKDSLQKTRLYQSTRDITLKKLTTQQYSMQNSKNSDSSSQQEKCFTNKCFTSRALGEKGVVRQNIDRSQTSNMQSGSQGQKGSFTNSFTKEASKSFRNIKAHTHQSQSKFPNKTTSSTLKILQKIKLQDQNPDQYTINKILISNQQKGNQQEHNKNKLMSKLGGINEELDNLFMSNVESEENQEENMMREREFEQMLDI